MVAAPMSLELHERGNHAVRTGHATELRRPVPEIRLAPALLGGHGEIRLHPGPAAGHRDRVLIRRETERDTDVIRAITTAAFAPRRPPGETVPEARLIDELRASPAWLPARTSRSAS